MSEIENAAEITNLPQEPETFILKIVPAYLTIENTLNSALLQPIYMNMVNRTVEAIKRYSEKGQNSARCYIQHVLMGSDNEKRETVWQYEYVIEQVKRKFTELGYYISVSYSHTVLVNSWATKATITIIIKW